MVSDPAVLFWSVSVARSLFTWLSEPTMVRFVVPEPNTPLPAAVRPPNVLATVTVKVSPVVLPVSERLTPLIGLARFTPTVAVGDTAITGSPLTVTAIVC